MNELCVAWCNATKLNQRLFNPFEVAANDSLRFNDSFLLHAAEDIEPLHFFNTIYCTESINQSLVIRICNACQRAKGKLTFISYLNFPLRIFFYCFSLFSFVCCSSHLCGLAMRT